MSDTKPLFSVLFSGLVFVSLWTPNTLLAAESDNRPMPYAIIGAVSSLAFACIQGRPPCIGGNYLNTDALTLSYDRGKDLTLTVDRFAIGADWNEKVYSTQSWEVTGRWDLNIQTWETNLEQPSSVNPVNKNYFKKSGTIIGFTPVFQYQLKTPSIRPYLELGGGMHLLLDKAVIEDENKSTQFQFGSILGLGLKGKRLEVSYRYTHFSNANIRMPNPGTDPHAIHIGWKL